MYNKLRISGLWNQGSFCPVKTKNESIIYTSLKECFLQFFVSPSDFSKNMDFSGNSIQF